MLSGLQVLGSIDQALLQAQQQTGALDQELHDLGDQLLRLREQEGAAYRTLAQVRLGAPKGDGLIERLKAIDGNVRLALQERSTAAKEINTAIAAIQQESEALRTERERATALIEERQAALMAAEEATIRALEQTQPYQAQREAAVQADRIAAAAEQKATQAEADRVEKGKPYEQDELFQYLWKRGFGTSTYSGRGVTRLLDRWVARLVAFDKARADYAMLQEIPRRLAEHAERQRAKAHEEAEKLKELQRAALDGGEAPARRAELAEAEAKVDAIDDAIEANADKAIAAFGRRAALSQSEGSVLAAATDVIEKELRSQDLQALRMAAAETASPDDDAAVRRLQQIEAEERQVTAAIERMKAERETQRRQMAEIESLRRDYRRRGYNRGMFDAAGGAMIGSLLAELLRGGLSRGGFWDRMDRHQQPWPQPGGGGGGGGWGGGGGSGTDSGGGDFRTGGGF